MSTSVLLVPGAPAVVPELSGSAAVDSECPVRRLVGLIRSAARGAGSVEVWGRDPAGRSHGDGRATLRRWGVDVPVGARAARELPEDSVPDAALLGWWFLDRAGVGLPRSFVGVPDEPIGPPVPEPGALVVVVADGPASLTPRAPLPEDPRGVALDARLATWVARGGPVPDPGADEASQVGWWSRPAWLALGRLTGGRAGVESVSWAPFGVGYHGARWQLDQTPAAGTDAASGSER